MIFGISVGSNDDDLPSCVKKAIQAERAGADFCGYGDTQALYRDYVSVLTAAALATSRVGLGPIVSNPVTRHPTVTANALATIDEASNQRAFLAIGAGASSAANAGVERAKPQHLTEAIHIFRSAFRDAPGPEGLDGVDTSVISIKWAKRKVPVIVHAAGPLGFKVAANCGDAVLIRLGDTPPEDLPDLIARVREDHAKGSRRQLPFDVWIYAPLAIAQDVMNARADVFGIVSARAVTLKPNQCPPEFADAVRTYVARYDYKFHASVREPKNYELLRDLGLADYMFRRFSLVGSEPQIVESVRALEKAGVSHTYFQAAGKSIDRVMASFADLTKNYRAQSDSVR